MIIMPIKEGENLERSLKKFMRKFERTGTLKELRARQQYVKPSARNRRKMEKAVYVEKMHREEDI